MARHRYATNQPKPCPFLGKACTILRGPNAGCVGQVIHYDRLENEFTLKIEHGENRVVWIWEPRHNTDLIKAQKHIRHANQL